MHPFGDKSGLVVRALLPGAKKVEVQPVHEKDKPRFDLKRIPTPTFLKASPGRHRRLCLRSRHHNQQGQTRRTRDAYSFFRRWANPILYLRQRRRAENLRQARAHLRMIDGVPGTSFASGAERAARQRRRRFQQLGRAGSFPAAARRSGVWEIFIPGVRQGAHYNLKSATRTVDQAEHRPVRVFLRGRAQAGRDRLDTRTFKWNDAAWLNKTPRTRCAPLAHERL